MTNEAIDHTGKRDGLVETLRRLPERCKTSGDYRYRVRWGCCGGEEEIIQRILTKWRTQPRTTCPLCGMAEEKVPDQALSGIKHPTWGLVFPLFGPFGPRWAVGGLRGPHSRADGM